MARRRRALTRYGASTTRVNALWRADLSQWER
jgi:hypothetical protein